MVPASNVEQKLITELATQARLLMPDFQIRYVQRIGVEPKQALLIGGFSSRISADDVLDDQLEVHDLCNSWNASSEILCGVSFTANPSKKSEEIELSFLPSGITAPHAMPSMPLTLMEHWTLPVLIVALLIAFILPHLVGWWQEMHSPSSESVQGNSSTRLRAVEALKTYKLELLDAGEKNKARLVDENLESLP